MASGPESPAKGDDMNLKGLLALLIVTIALVVIVNASAQSDSSLIANVPFSFSVQQEQFQAGQYVVEPMQHGYLKLRGSDNRSVILHVSPNYSHENSGPKGKLVFRRYGQDYFLYQAWIPSADFGVNFDQSNLETQVARKNNNKKEFVAVQGR